MIKWRIWKSNYTGKEGYFDVYNKKFDSKEMYENYLQRLEYDESNWPYIDMNVASVPIKAETRKLKASFSMEVPEKMKILWGLEDD